MAIITEKILLFPKHNKTMLACRRCYRSPQFIVRDAFYIKTLGFLGMFWHNERWTKILTPATLANIKMYVSIVDRIILFVLRKKYSHYYITSIHSSTDNKDNNRRSRTTIILQKFFNEIFWSYWYWNANVGSKINKEVNLIDGLITTSKLQDNSEHLVLQWVHLTVWI